MPLERRSNRWLKGIAVAILALSLILGNSYISSLSAVEPQTPNLKTFYDWCANQPKLALATRHTIQILLEAVKTSDCKQAEERLSSLESFIHLEGSHISDLSPLQSVKHFKLLDLSNNQITNLEPIKLLVNLSVLNLNNNQISNLSPLNSLIGLNWIDLSRNQISNIEPLQSLPNLNLLAIRWNRISNISPLQFLVLPFRKGQRKLELVIIVLVGHVYLSSPS